MDKTEAETEHVKMVKKYKAVFGSVMGQDVLHDLLEMSGFLEVGNLENLKFEAGKRFLMKGILEMVDTDYKVVRNMVNQKKKERTRRFGHESNAEIFDN